MRSREWAAQEHNMQQKSEDKPEIGPDRSHKNPTNIQNNKQKKYVES